MHALSRAHVQQRQFELLVGLNELPIEFASHMQSLWPKTSSLAFRHDETMRGPQYPFGAPRKLVIFAAGAAGVAPSMASSSSWIP